jgi:RNA polymerase sigma factor (sigma-70 family)
MAAGNRTLATTVDHGVDFDAVYEDHLALLVGTAVDRFHISEMDAETLAHEVFLAYFLKADQVNDSTAWLVGAMCNASRYYLRTQARQVELSSEVVSQMVTGENVTEQEVVAREMLCCLTPRCQLALGLHYLEGYTVPEVATELRTTLVYAHKLMIRCVRQARRRYKKKVQQ